MFVGVDFVALDKPKFDFLTIPDKSYPPFVPTAIEEDKLGNMWFGSDMNYMKRWNRYGKKAITITEMPYRAKKIMRLKNSQTLVLAYNSTFVWDPANVQYPVRTTDGADIQFVDVCTNLQDDAILAVQSDSSIGHIWQIKPLRGGKQYQAVRLKLPLPAETFSRIFVDSNNRLYLAINNAVAIYQFDKEHFRLLKTTTSSGVTKAIFEDKKYVWAVGTYGLCRINKANLVDTLVQEKNGLPNNSVYGMLQEEKRDLLWISTNQGLIRFHPDTFGFRQYKLADGLQDYEFNHESFLRDSDGKFWFGGIKGINVFDPAQITDLTVNAPVYITKIQINDAPYEPGKNVTLLDSLILKPDQNTVSFDLVAVEFSDPQNTKIRYQLRYAKNDEPYDANWIESESSKGFARYPKLKYGKYYFYMQGANSDGVWNNEIRRIYLEVEPKFTETFGFVVLCAFILTVLSYIGVRLYIANKLRLKNLQLREQSIHIEKQDALTQERNRIAGEMHDDLGGGLTSIRMLSERVQRKITNPDIQKSVDKISVYSQDLVLRMSEIIWAMNSNFDTLDNLVSYIRNFAVKYLGENEIQCSIQRPHDIPEINMSGERRRNLYLAVKESLHNIVKHANAKRVNIDFILNNKMEVRIQDDGKGIDPEKMNEFGNGLFNMRKRLESIGGSMDLKSQDGTLIIFKVPIKPDKS
jgi:signal transduction histidine kinase